MPKKWLSLDKLTEYDALIKAEIDKKIDAFELITVDDVDTICGSSIQYASENEVTF